MAEERNGEPIALLLYLTEIPWATRLAAELRGYGYSPEAWVFDADEANAARATGAFDFVLEMGAGFRRSEAIDSAQREELFRTVKAIEERVGEPFIRQLAASDRTLTGMDHLELPPPRIKRRWTWVHFAQMAAHLDTVVRDRIDAAPPAAAVGELGGFTNRFLGRVLKSHGVPVLGANPVTYHDERVYFRDDLDGQWPECIAEYENMLDSGEVKAEVRAQAIELRDRIRVERTLHIPRSGVATFLPTPMQRYGPARVLNVLSIWRDAGSSENLHSPRTTYPEMVTPWARARRKVRRSRTVSTFDQVADRSMPSTPYATYFLHAQPEVTVEGWSFDFSDQVAVIRSIAARLPADVLMTVKEHACQAGLRDPSFYAELLSVPGVQLLHDSLNTRDLIAGAEAVFTLTGTVSLEAMCLGVPAIIFGSVYYEHFAGIRRVHSFEELGDIIQDLDEFPLATEDQVHAALASRISASHIGGWHYGARFPADPVTSASAIAFAVGQKREAETGAPGLAGTTPATARRA